MGYVAWRTGGALSLVLAAIENSGHVGDMSAMIAAHQEYGEGGGGGEDEFK